MSRVPKPFQGDMFFNGMYTVVRKKWLRDVLAEAESEIKGAAEEAMAFAGGKGDNVSLERVLDYVCNTMGRNGRREVRTALYGEDEEMPRLASSTTNSLAAAIAQRRLCGTLTTPAAGGGGETGRRVVLEEDQRVYVSTRRKA